METGFTFMMTPLPPCFPSQSLPWLASWGQVCEWRHQAEVAEILEILKGRVLAGLDRVAVLRVMVERRALTLK